MSNLICIHGKVGIDVFTCEDCRTATKQRLRGAEEEAEVLRRALREIGEHIEGTTEPIPYIIETLKRVLPEYNEDWFEGSDPYE